MNPIANSGAETPHPFSPGSPAAGAAAVGRPPAADADSLSPQHDPEAKALLRRYLSEIHSYREIGNHALRDLEARLAALPNQPAPETDSAAAPVTAHGRPASASALTQPSLPAEARAAREDPGLSERLRELSTYLHADLARETAGRERAAVALPPAAPPAAAPRRSSRPRPQQQHKIPTAPVLDRAWFEERFAALRASIDEIAGQAPLQRLAALEAQFQELMERLAMREAARDQRPLEASLKELATYLADSRQWAARNEARVRSVEEKIDRLSGLVAKSNAAISATAHGLEIVAKGTGETLVRDTARLVTAGIEKKLDAADPSERLDQLGKEVAHLSMQSRHLARSAEDRLQQIQNALAEQSRAPALAEPPAQPSRPGTQPARKPGDSASRKALESYLNRPPLEEEDDYDSDMIAAAHHAARLADAQACGPSRSGPVRYQIPYGEFLPDDSSQVARSFLVLAILILLLAGAGLLFLKLKDWASGATAPAAAYEEGAPLSGGGVKQGRLSSLEGGPGTGAALGVASDAMTVRQPLGTPVVIGSTPAAPPLGSKPVQLWVSASASAEPGDGAKPLADSTEIEESPRRAAIQGDRDAQFTVGQGYLSGQEGDPTLSGGDRLSKAARWFRRAAESGHAPSQYRLATLYETGSGAPSDLLEAESWYRRAAEQGHVKAMHNLAVLAAGGGRRPANYLTAARWFREAAEHGVADSQYNLGILYERGLGVAANRAEAYRWFALAARQNDPNALQKRNHIGRQLSPAERGEAERLLALFSPKPIAQAANRVAPEPPASAERAGRSASTGLAEPGSASLIRASWTADLAPRPKRGKAAVVAEGQRLLKLMGYDPGPADGVPGPRTEAAVRNFQRRSGLAVTGQISEGLVVKMAFMQL